MLKNYAATLQKISEYETSEEQELIFTLRDILPHLSMQEREITLRCSTSRDASRIYIILIRLMRSAQRNTGHDNGETIEKFLYGPD